MPRPFLRNRRPYVQTLLAGTCTLLALLWQTAGARALQNPPTGYSMVDLGALNGGQSYGLGISDTGVVAGSNEDADGTRRGFVWTETLGLQPLPALGNPHVTTASNGVVVERNSADGPAVIWTEASGELDLLPGGLRAFAFVRRNGAVYGFYEKPGFNAGAFAWSPDTSLVDIGALTGALNSTATAANRTGMVVGGAGDVCCGFNPGVNERAFAWTPSGGLTDLGTLGGSMSHALALNDAGTVVGLSTLPGDAVSHAFVWTQATGMVDIDPSGRATDASYISETGVIAGAGPSGGWVWSENAGFQTLPSAPKAISETGVLIGDTYVWTESRARIDLSLGGSWTSVEGVSATGIVFGNGMTTGDAEQHSFVWTQTGGLVEIGTLGGSMSFANAINDIGAVVGSSTIAGDAASHAFIWTPGVGLVDLGSLGGTESAANAINNSGVVTGTSTLPGDTVSHVVVWTPDTPQPAPAPTPMGGNIVVSPADVATGATPVTLTFTTVTSAGETTLTTLTDIIAACANLSGDCPLPLAFALGSPPVLYNVSTTAQFSGLVKVCVSFDPANYPPGSQFRLVSLAGSRWHDVTTSAPAGNVICGDVASLSLLTVVRRRVVFSPYDNGTLGADHTDQWAMNASGQIVGWSLTAAPDFAIHAYSWTLAGGIIDLGTLGGSTSHAWGVNKAGTVVGDSETADGDVHAFVWTASGGLVDLGEGSAKFINDSGQVVVTDVSIDPDHGNGYVWSAADGIVPFPLGCDQLAAGNNSGQFLLVCDSGTLLWTPGQPGIPVGLSATVALGRAPYRLLNDKGQVVGDKSMPDGSSHTFLWSVVDGMRDLGGLGGDSQATAVSATGDVAGSFSPTGSCCDANQRHAFVWTPAEGMVDLGLGTAQDVNAAGYVVGYALDPLGGSTRTAWLWTPASGRIVLDVPQSLPEVIQAVAYLINDRGQIMGATAGPRHGLMWQVPLAPSFTNANTTTVTAGSSSAFTINANGSPTLTLTESGALPTGVTFTDNGDGTATLGGTPGFGTAGTYSITFTATNSVDTANQAFTLVIEAAAPIPAPTPVGTNVAVTPVDSTTGTTPITLTFANVTSAGDTMLTTAPDCGQDCFLPLAFETATPPVFYNLTTTAVFDGVVHACIDISGLGFPAGSQLRLLHLEEDGVFHDVTTSGPTGNVICGDATSLNWFTVVRRRIIFSPTDIGTLPGSNYTRPYAMNSHGQIVGDSRIPGSQRPLSWTAAGGIIDLGSLGGDFGYALSVGNSGVVVGQSQTANGDYHGFVWTAATGMIDIGDTDTPEHVNDREQVLGNGGHVWTADTGWIDPPPECQNAWGRAINNRGQVLLQCDSGSFLWTPGQPPIPVGGPDMIIGRGGWSLNTLNLLNDSGQVVGSVNGHAVLWSAEEGIRDLGMLGGDPTYGTAVGSTGQVVGYSSPSGSTEVRAFSWTSAGGMIDLGPGYAQGLNAAGYVVGLTLDPQGTQDTPWLWTPAGGRIQLDVPQSLPELMSARAFLINDRGQIMGSAFPRRGLFWQVPLAPSLTSANTTTFTAGSNSAFTISSNGSPTLTLTETGALPSGVTFTDNGDGTATLGGTAWALTAGSYPLTLTATNSEGTANQAFTLIVEAPAIAPAISTADHVTFTVGTAGSFTVSTTGSPAAGVTAIGTLPVGVQFAGNGDGTATLQGTPAAFTGGTYPLTLTATNGVNPDAVQSFVLTINEAPAIITPDSAVFTLGLTGSFGVMATGFPTATLSETGTLPAGVTFNPATGVLAGTPAAGTSGTYPITFTATNGIGTNATQPFTLTVSFPLVQSIELSPTSVQGGAIDSLATVTLNAPAVGTTAQRRVTLASDNTGAATVPATITIPAGQTTATFTVTSQVVTSTATATISATMNGGTPQTAALTVLPLPAVASLTLNPTSVIGGAQNSTATVTLNAPAVGTVAQRKVTLGSDNAAATVPASVTVAVGATSATFTVTSLVVGAPATAHISATLNGLTSGADLAVTPLPSVASVTLTPTSVTGGAVDSVATVTLTAPAIGTAAQRKVTLASDNTAAATVPATVTVPLGATSATFTVTSLTVPAATVANISGALNGGSASTALSVVPLPVAVSVSFDANPVVGGSTNPIATVTLSAAAVGTTAQRKVTLVSGNTAVATVPASVVVPAGATSATFTVTSKVVAAASTAGITATMNGVAAPAATLAVNPLLVVSLSLTTGTVTGGTNVTATITLNAPAAGTTAQRKVTLASDNAAAASVPASVTVPTGSTSMTFTVTTHVVATNTTVHLTATLNGVTVTTSLTVLH